MSLQDGDIVSLQEMPASALQRIDCLAIADLSASENKKITANNLLQAGLAFIDDGSIPIEKVDLSSFVPSNLDGAGFSVNSIPGDRLKDNTVPGAKLLSGTISSRELGESSVTATELSAGSVSGSVGGSKITIKAGSIGQSEIAELSIGTEQLLSASVTEAKLAIASVTSSKIASGAVMATHLGVDSVGPIQLIENSVSSEAVGSGEISGGAGVKNHIAAQSISTGDIAAAAITKALIGANQVDALRVEAASISGSEGLKTHIAANSLNSNDIASGGITDVALAEGSVQTSKIQDGAVGGSLSSGKITPGSVGAADIGASQVQASHISNGAVGTAALADLAVTAGKLADGVITDEKVSEITGEVIANGTISSNHIESGSITTDQLSANAVTDSKIADGACVNSKIAPGLSGSKIQDTTLPAIALDPGTINRGLDLTDGSIGIANSIAAGVANGISFSEQGLIVGAESLSPADLPIATPDVPGVVAVPDDSGLTVTAEGDLSINNSTAAQTVSGITITEKGLISSAVPLDSSDLPIASTTEVGGVQIAAGLNILGTGELSLENLGSSGTYTSVEVDVYGRVTGGSDSPGTISNLDASVITSGQFPTERIADGAITNAKLAPYSVTFIQDIEPGPAPAGTLWYQETTQFLSVRTATGWRTTSVAAVDAGEYTGDLLRQVKSLAAQVEMLTAKLTEAGVLTE